MEYKYLCNKNTHTRIPLLVTTGDGKHKSIVYDLTVHKGVNDLLRLAQAKVNSKSKPTIAWTQQGKVITDDLLITLEPESVIRVGRVKHK